MYQNLTAVDLLNTLINERRLAKPQFSFHATANGVQAIVTLGFPISGSFTSFSAIKSSAKNEAALKALTALAQWIEKSEFEKQKDKMTLCTKTAALPWIDATAQTA